MGHQATASSETRRHTARPGWARPLIRAAALAGGVMLLGAVAAWRSPSSPLPALVGAPGSSQDEQIAAGQIVYETACAGCHGDQGEGLEGPRLVGRGSELPTFRNARRVFDYVRDNMPEAEPGSLSDQEYYDVVAFLLARNNLNPGNSPVSAATAEGITFSQ